jgi:NAD(P)-dependent dehydrogenase (short-subunit alcohol dehydrogenase family)
MDPLSLFSLKGKTAVITGGTGVLGTSMTHAISEAGANVAVLGRRKEAGDALVAQLKNAISIKADVLEPDQLKAARDIVLKEFGGIDILVNAAGGNMPGAVVQPDSNFFAMKIDDFRKVVDLNLLGSVLPSQIFCEDMAKRKKGVIINIASMAAMRTITRVAGYSAAKAAITNFTS